MEARKLLFAALAACTTSAARTSWPPPIAPVWPTVFTAWVHGASPGSNITAESGKWYYEWPTDRYRADYLNIFDDGSSRNDTQFWDAGNRTFYFFEDNFATCGFFKMPLSILRPDWAEKSNSTWLNRSTVEGVESDVYFADGGPGNQFYLAQDPRTNLPVKMWGTDGGGNSFDSIVVGGDWKKPDYEGPDPFNSLDMSLCTQVSSLSVAQTSGFLVLRAALALASLDSASGSGV